MTKKDYVLIANALHCGIHNALVEMSPEQYIKFIVSNVAFALKQDNPKFDALKFYNAVEI